jgi:hypothetical protein
MTPEALYTTYTLGGIITSLPFIRASRIQVLKLRANEKMALNSSESQSLAETISELTNDKVTAAELGSYGVITAADFVWSWATIDPNVIKAADFGSSYDIHNGFQFAQYLHSHFDALTTGAKDGFLNRLLGYIGERQAADILAHQGHIVELAATANQPVWDLLVDGHAVNIKTVADIASVKAEAVAHPGVLYLVPEDAHGHATGNIVHLAGFNHEAAKESLHEALSSAKGETALHSLFHHLPLVTIGFTAYRNIKAVQKGKNPLVAVHHGVAETVGRGTGVLLGAKGGAAAGFFFGPAGALIGGVLGGFGGALLGGAAAEKYKKIPLQKAMNNFDQELNIFGRSFRLHFDEIHQYLQAPLVRMQCSLRDLTGEAEKRKKTLRWKLWPDFYTVLLDEAIKNGLTRVQTEQNNVVRVNMILNEATKTHSYTKVGLIMVNSPAIRELVGFDPALLERIEVSRQQLFYQRKQYNPNFVIPS